MGQEVLRVVGFGVASALLLVLVRRERPEMALILSLGAGVLLLLIILPLLGQVTTLIETLTSRAHVRLLFFDSVLKIIGIAYLAEFGAQIARDAGEGAVAGRIELAAKVMILLLALPIVNAILDLVLRLLP
jgi:stage III sporulation protein AD